MDKLTHQIVDYRCRRVPIVVVDAADVTEVEQQMFDYANDVVSFAEDQFPKKSQDIVDRENTVGIVVWDISSGTRPLNAAGTEALSKVTPQSSTSNNAGDPRVLLRNLYLKSVQEVEPLENTIFLFKFKQSTLGNVEVLQAIENLRDIFSERRNTFVIVGKSLIVPEDIVNDILIIKEDLPNFEECKIRVREGVEASGRKIDEEKLRRAADAVLGCTRFQVDQIAATSLDRKVGAIDMSKLWKAKEDMIQQQAGIEMFTTDLDYSDIVGLENLAETVRLYFEGPNAPNGIVFIDEIDKSINRNTHDSSGVSADQLNVTLTEMNDTKAAGMLLLGVPGVGKSMIAQTAGKEFGVPTMKLDYGAMKGSLVGQSEGAVRACMKKIRAITSGKALWIATCNNVEGLPPELKRRFSFGTYFCDIPTKENLPKLWDVYRKVYATSGQVPEVDNWTGAEIANCCRISEDLGIPLEKAMKSVVSVWSASKTDVMSLRSQADGKIISADYEGVYKASSADVPTPAKGKTRARVNE